MFTERSGMPAPMTTEGLASSIEVMVDQLGFCEIAEDVVTALLEKFSPRDRPAVFYRLIDLSKTKLAIKSSPGVHLFVPR